MSSKQPEVQGQNFPPSPTSGARTSGVWGPGQPLGPTQGPESSDCFLFPTLVPHCIWPRNFGCGWHHILGMILFFSLNLLPSSWFISPGLKLDSSWTSFFGLEDTPAIGESPPHKPVASHVLVCLCFPSAISSPPHLPFYSLHTQPAPYDFFPIYHRKTKCIYDCPEVQANSLF